MGARRRTTSSSAPTARASITWPASSTTTTSRSPTSSAPRSTCRTRRGRSSSPQALGYPLPEYAHLPYVAEPGSKNKLSKRKIDAVPEEPRLRQGARARHAIAAAMKLHDRARDVQPGHRRFLRAGRLPARRDRQLPAAARLVARRQDRVLHAREMIENFSLERVNKAPASFDPDEAARVPGAVHAATCRSPRRSRGVLPFLERAGLVRRPSPTTRAPTSAASSRRSATASRCSATSCCRRRSSSATRSTFDDKAFAKRVLAPGAAERLADYRGWLAERRPPSTPPSLEAETQA